MRYEEIYRYTGQLGTCQMCIFFCLFMIYVCGVDNITMIFVGGEMEHWCRVPELSRYSFERQKYIAVPTDGSDTDSYSSCEMFDLNYTVFADDDFRNWNRTEVIANQTDRKQCTEWVYDQTTFVSTIVSRFNLVCGLDFLNQLVVTVYMIGVMFGVATGGMLSDRIGRKSTMVIYVGIRLTGLVFSSWALNYPMFLTGRFIMAIGGSGGNLAAYVLAMETVGPKYRTFASVGVHMGFTVGFCVQPLIAYFVRSDIRYQLASLGPSVISLSYVLFIPESSRWLVVNGRLDEGLRVIRHTCAVNRTSLPPDFDLKQLDQKSDSEHKRQNCFALMRTPRMRWRTTVLYFIWISCNLVYFSFSLNTGVLAGSIYINTFLAGVVEIPAKIVCLFLLDWKFLGRRLTGAGVMFVTSVSCFVCVPLILYGYNGAVTAFVMIGKAFITMSLSTLYVYSSEIFPTEVRNIGVGSASLFGRLGGMTAPFMGSPLVKVWEPLPSLIFGVVSLVSGGLFLLLPETLGEPLMDTVEQAEQFTGKSKSSVAAEDVIVINNNINGEPPKTGCANGTTSGPTNGVISGYVNPIFTDEEKDTANCSPRNSGPLQTGTAEEPVISNNIETDHL